MAMVEMVAAVMEETEDNQPCWYQKVLEGVVKSLCQLVSANARPSSLTIPRDRSPPSFPETLQ